MNLKDMKTSNKALLLIATVLVVFTIVMIILFAIKGNVPDTLIISVFSCCGFECGALGYIKGKKIDSGDYDDYSHRAE